MCHLSLSTTRLEWRHVHLITQQRPARSPHQDRVVSQGNSRVGRNGGYVSPMPFLESRSMMCRLIRSGIVPIPRIPSCPAVYGDWWGGTAPLCHPTPQGFSIASCFPGESPISGLTPPSDPALSYGSKRARGCAITGGDHRLSASEHLKLTQFRDNPVIVLRQLRWILKVSRIPVTH